MSFINIAQQVGNIQADISIVSQAFAQFDALFALDVVAVLDSDFNQLFDLARPMKANINPQSKLMMHPIEDGSLITDFRIILPLEIELGMLITGDEYRSVYQQIKTSFLNADSLIVQTRADTYFNMVIEAMPHDESVDQFDVLPIALKLKEAILIQVQYQALPPEAVATPADQSTVKRGAQQPQNSIAYDGLQAVKKWFGN